MCSRVSALTPDPYAARWIFMKVWCVCTIAFQLSGASRDNSYLSVEDQTATQPAEVICLTEASLQDGRWHAADTQKYIPSCMPNQIHSLQSCMEAYCIYLAFHLFLTFCHVYK